MILEKQMGVKAMKKHMAMAMLDEGAIFLILVEINMLGGDLGLACDGCSILAIYITYTQWWCWVVKKKDRGKSKHLLKKISYFSS